MLSVQQEERAKYAEIWQQVPEYRNFSPGMQNVDRFMSIINPAAGSSLVDVGCGEGKAGLDFQARGLLVDWVDITDAGLSPEVPRKRGFTQSAIWHWAPAPGWDYGFCCDVMEHIPPEYTMLCIARIMDACETAWFQICNVPDQFGQRIGRPLHLTVQPFTWWRDRLSDFGMLVEARDLCGNSLFVVSR
jgi:hypothetical protein